MNIIEVLLGFLLTITIAGFLLALYSMIKEKKVAKKKPADRFPIQTEYPIEPYFEVGGRTYYAFTNTSNLPAGRSLAALKYFMQLKTNCDDNYLRSFQETMAAVLADPAKISLEKLIALKNQLGDRLTWAFTPAIIYRYASVLYLDKDENPYTYDEDYNAKKIEFWKAHSTFEAFFLSEPFLKLIPYSTSVEGSLPTYSLAVIEAELLQLRELLSLHSTMLNSAATASSLNSQITMLEMLRDYAKSRQTSISSTSPSDIRSIKNE